MHDLIVVPVDGSKLAERAFALAVPLAQQHGARLALLHAQPRVLETIVRGGVTVLDPTFDNTRRQEMERYVKRAAKRVQKQTGIAVEPHVREGEAAEVIATFAAAAREGLVVMSSHGRGGFKRFWLGSVADRLLHQARVPVLLLKGGRSTGSRMTGAAVFTRMLVAVDGSERSEVALRAAQALLAGTGGSITLAHVIDSAVAVPATHLQQRPEQFIGESYLAPLAREATTDGVEVDYRVVVDDSVAPAIVQLAGELDADCVVVATRGAGATERLIFGSVADKVVRTSPVPVFVCPAVR